MNYKDLYPGRQRRLAYSKLIDNRNNRNRLGRNFTNQRRNAIISLNEDVSSFSIARNAIFEIASENLNEDTWTYENLVELNENNVQIGLVNKNLVEQSTVELNLFEDNFCVVCQENIDTNIYLETSIIRILKCTHCFHIKCIDTWFTENNKCPTCKNEITEIN